MNNHTDLQKEYHQKTDEELLDVYTHIDQYLEEIKPVVLDELKSRNIAIEKLDEAVAEVKSEDEAKANESLSKWWIVCLVLIGFPGIIPAFILSDYYKTKGYTRKSSQIWKVFWIGFGIQIFIVFILK